ncbi:hypothetical protein H4R34_000250 [Dimargaris verticillata]|uniref:5-oxoprolinase n=1 Tax=Dimargaris verticillata TaxID=2761393 RepID=A0A9W8B8I7_9FUNG|nr:hypothetical protein H4R34_000250 [Dimargaris verticillata]
MATVSNLDICIDRGGTFTDCYCSYDVAAGGRTETKELVIKLLSQDPQNYDDAPREGIRRLLAQLTGKAHSRGQPIDTTLIRSIRMGTTVATNALLERKGEPCALVTTRGFRDLLVVGNQARPKIFALDIRRLEVLYQQVVEVDERVTLWGHTSGGTGAMHYPSDHHPDRPTPADCIRGISGELVQVLQALDQQAVRQQLQALYDQGIRSLAVCLMHAYTFSDHERQVGKIAQDLGFTQITLSHQAMPMIKIVPRGNSACADAYLTPGIQRYVQGFVYGFDERLLKTTSVQFMQSDGGLAPVDKFSGLRAILSGPAGGVVGCALTSYHVKEDVPVIGFDMGGTSTDVSRFDGDYSQVFETTTAGIVIQAPQLDIHTVAAGGGSRLFFRNELFAVGPESASAHPGPACYRKGGPLTVTDANLVLGRLLSDYFPQIFGPNEDLPLDIDKSRALFVELATTINQARQTSNTAQPDLSIDEVAYGFIKVANETMCRPIRALTEAKGYDASQHILTCFGGAGGQHACAIAQILGIRKVLIHRFSSILSAYGLHLADVVHEVQEPSSMVLPCDAFPASLKNRIRELSKQCRVELERQGFAPDQIELEPFLNLRYQGTDCAMMTKARPDQGRSYVEAFEANYMREFGFHFSERSILVDDVRIRGIGRNLKSIRDATPFHELQTLTPLPLMLESGTQSQPSDGPMPRSAKVDSWASVYFAGGRNPHTPVLLLSHLTPGDQISGPAVVIDPTFTVIVEPQWQVLVTSTHLILTKAPEEVPPEEPTGSLMAKAVPNAQPNGPSAALEQPAPSCDPIMLSVFSHRFMSIAEQMGTTLQKTAISTNIKERLDFSCAIFGPDGSLVANAPHIPVHLGSIGHAVKYQLAYWKDNLQDGDVLLTNHPQAGGSHLPDMTVITPVFDESGQTIIFFVASRGHHADIGGILPGSMPPTSCDLYQEGAAIEAFKIVDCHQFQLQGITRLLVDEPARYPKCSGTRCLRDNLSDLKAQIAANNRGITLLRRLVREYRSLSLVHAYMGHIQSNAEVAVRRLLLQTHKRFGGAPLQAHDYMDNGARIQLRVTIEPQTATATFDFTGTSPQVYGNLNAPPSVTFSAVIYCLRCMVDTEVPLNQGCLAPIDIIIPDQSLLNPGPGRAVVGGNVQTSQRVVDVIFRAFEACAASQGDMNNLTFGVGHQAPSTAPPPPANETTLAGSSPNQASDAALSSDKSEDGNGTGWGYYETIAGGSGAGPTWDGVSGVHTHMTNTRITDPEILERRYPVILHEFSIRSGSGGHGQHRGGDGLVREIEFLEPISVSILSERRVFAPYGLQGGASGQRGENYWLRKRQAGTAGAPSSASLDRATTLDQYEVLSLGGKNTCLMQPGDKIRICTPGGGGWGLQH